MMGRRNDRRRLEEVAGRRVETVEWGARTLYDEPLGRKAGHVDWYSGEEHARHVVYNPERRYYIMSPIELVRRTVVTYTTAAETIPGEPAPVKTNMRLPEPAEDPQVELF